MVDPDPGVRALALRLAVRLAARPPTRASTDRSWLLRALHDPAPEVRRQAVAAVRQLQPPGAVSALLAAWPRLPGLESPVGAALAALATEADVPALAAVAREGSPSARIAALQGLVTALAAARTAGARTARPALAALAAALERGGAEGELAADALAASSAGSLDVASGLLEASVRRSWQSSDPALRARLCAVMARLPGVAEALTAALLDPREAPEVQAAAAWALAGRRDPHVLAALERARDAGHPAVASNARAALALTTSAAAGPPVRMQLERPEGGPDTGRPWLVAQEGELAVWVRAGALGQVAIPWPGRSPASLSVRLAEPQQLLQHPGDRLGQVTGHQVPAAQLRAGLRPRQTMGVDTDHRRVGRW
jgi:hypothetical protein